MSATLKKIVLKVDTKKTIFLQWTIELQGILYKSLGSSEHSRHDRISSNNRLDEHKDHIDTDTRATESRISGQQRWIQQAKHFQG